MSEYNHQLTLPLVQPTDPRQTAYVAYRHRWVDLWREAERNVASVADCEQHSDTATTTDTGEGGAACAS